MSQISFGIWAAAKDAPHADDVETPVAPEPWRGPLSWAAFQARRDAEARAEYADFFGDGETGGAA